MSTYFTNYRVFRYDPIFCMTPQILPAPAPIYYYSVPHQLIKSEYYSEHNAPLNPYNCPIHYYSGSIFDSFDVEERIRNHKGCELPHDMCCNDPDYKVHCAWYCQKGDTIIYIRGYNHHHYSVSETDFAMIDKCNILFTERSHINRYPDHEGIYRGNEYNNSEAVIIRNFQEKNKQVLWIDEIINIKPYSDYFNEAFTNIGGKFIPPMLRMMSSLDLSIKSVDMRRDSNVHRNRNGFSVKDFYWINNFRNNYWKVNYVDKYSKGNTCFLSCGLNHVGDIIQMLADDGFDIKPVPETSKVCIPNKW